MKSAIFILAAVCSLSVFAQDYSGTTNHHTLPSEAFGKERKIDVFLPSAYEENKTDSVMVIYVFDSQFDAFFDMVSYTANYLNAVGEFPNFIAVGIHTEYRQNEFTPAPNHPETQEAWGPETEVGKSDLLEAHLNEEVMPFIEKNYRTQPLKMAIGHSLGGTFVTNCLIEHPEMFKAVISISPNTQYDQGHLIADLDTLLRNNQAPKAFHFMTAGTVGNMENSFRKASDRLDSVYRAHPSPNLIWEYHTYDGLNHMLTPMQTISEGLVSFGRLMTLSDGKALSFLEDKTKSYADHLREHFDSLSDWLGYPNTPSADEINGLGYLAGYEEQWEAALGVFDWALELYPNHPNLNDSRGEALENLKDFNSALASYQRAMDLVEEQKESLDKEMYEYYLEMIGINLNRAKELVASED
jgi:predicted alpha/beta superfamily hydrolase